MATADPRVLAGLAAAWVAAGLNLGLLFDLKATMTTLTALLILSGLVLGVRLALLALVGFLAAGIVFAAFIIHPAAAIVALLLAIWGLAVLGVRFAELADLRQGAVFGAAFAAVLWPPFLGLVSNSVVEVVCPDGGLEDACYGFYRVALG